MSELTPTAVVTGGSRGLGRTIALTLAAAGYQIFFTYVSRPEAADAVVAEIEAAETRRKPSFPKKNPQQTESAPISTSDMDRMLAELNAFPGKEG
jgi:NAD(P)-dependent dehydrogenase (short-subunit alcohol dehydrogenase family)